jgi:hypothetical protein
VALVYPVRSRLFIVFVFVFFSKIALRSFIVEGDLSHYFCCFSWCLFFIHFIRSCGKYFSLCGISSSRAFLAASSPVSLPGFPS